jgi:hypothetical protein
MGACATGAVVERVGSFLVALTKMMSRSPIPNPMPTIHLPVVTSEELSLFPLGG